ncbi:MAG: hypothetical protein HFI90_04495 [Clostridia bacterium]|nr:hypothetical protein [Clostridia bacterium]
MEKLRILFLTDLHYIGKAEHTCNVAVRQTHLAAVLLKQVFEQVPAEAYDVIVLGGDLTDNGNAVGAEEDLLELKQIMKAQNKPVLVVRGNHDAPEELFQNMFADETQPVTAGGYHLLGFSDCYRPGVPGQRDWAKMEELFAAVPPEQPVIVFQHSPVYPPIEDEYPYNLAEAEQMMRFYEEHHVVLSVSGHLHRGMPPMQSGGVMYLTGAALCETPFCYAIIQVEGEAAKYHQYHITPPSV